MATVRYWMHAVKILYGYNNVITNIYLDCIQRKRQNNREYDDMIAESRWKY